MRNALIIAAREFEEKRFVALAVVAFAVLPFLVGVIPMINGRSSREAIALSSLMLATAFTVGLAVITGAGFVGRDLSDGRMSFYFSRPIGSSSIWFGKLTAGILMIVGCFGFIIAPAWLATGKYWTSFWDLTLGDSSAWILTIALSLFLVAHVIGTFARSRAPLVAGDFAAAVLCGVAIWFIVLPLARGMAFTLAQWLLIALAVALALAIIGGGAWQLERGRTDRRRNHVALSQFIWGTMAVALLIAAGYVTWVVSVTPRDLTTRIYASHQAGSPFFVVSGRARHRGDYYAAFLIDVGDGSVRRIDPQGVRSVHFARDGRSAVVPRLEGTSADLLVYTHGSAEPNGTGLTVSHFSEFFVSDDASRVALLDGRNLSIYDVPRKRSLVSVRVPSEGSIYAQGYFVSLDLFRLCVQSRDGLSILELDTRVRGLRTTGGIAGGGFVTLAVDPTGSRMLVGRHNSDDVTLNDARTGAVLETILKGKAVQGIRFLRDGRMAIVERSPRMTLHIFSTDGTLQRDIPLDDSDRASIVGDDGTRLVVSTANSLNSPGTLVAVNIDRGVIERRESRERDWTMTNWFWDNRPPIQPLREVFFGDGAGHVVGWSPATGAKRMLTGG